MSFWSIFQGFLTDACNSMIEDFIAPLDAIMGDLLYASFYVESLPGLHGTFLTPLVVSRVFNAMYGLLISLLIVKILWKGFKVFILWRDGDADQGPMDMVLGGGMALIVAAIFPIMYDIGVQFIYSVIDTISKALFPDTLVEITGVIDALGKMLGMAFNFIVFGLVYGVLLICLMFSMLKQGAEMFVFRLGIPVAVIGLVDSDGGVWKPYIQTLFRQYVSAIIRYLCLMISIRLVFSLTFMGVIVGIVFVVVALKTPAMLAQFLAPKNPGGGVAQKTGLLISALRIFGGA